MINNVQVLTFHVGPTVLTEITIDTLIRNFLLNKSYESLKDIVTVVDNGDDLFTEYVGKFYDRRAMTLWFDNAKHYTLPNHDDFTITLDRSDFNLSPFKQYVKYKKGLFYRNSQGFGVRPDVSHIHTFTDAFEDDGKEWLMVCDDDVIFTQESNKILTEWMESDNDVLLNGGSRSTNFFLCKIEVFRELFSDETKWPVKGRGNTTTLYDKWGLERADKITLYTERIGGQYFLDGYEESFMIHWGGRGERIDKFFINHKEDGYYNLLTWINQYKDKINDNNDFPADYLLQRISPYPINLRF